MASYRVHMVADIEGILSRSDRELKKNYLASITEDDGKRFATPTALRVALCKLLASGQKFIPMGCPTPNADGSCPRHDIEGEVSNA